MSSVSKSVEVFPLRYRVSELDSPLCTWEKQTKRELGYASGKQALFSVMGLIVHLLVHSFIDDLLYKHLTEGLLCALHYTGSLDSVTAYHRVPASGSLRAQTSVKQSCGQ